MFTGIVEAMGEVVKVDSSGSVHRLVIAAPVLGDSVGIGDSVAVNGVCLTAVQVDGDRMTRRGRAGDASSHEPGRPGGRRGGERRAPRFPPTAASAGISSRDTLDATCTITMREPDGGSEMVSFTLPPAHAVQVVPKGFVALDGVSLTVVDASAEEFRVALIPHTRAVVTLGAAEVGYRANLEVDVLAKYVERAMSVMPREAALSRAQLQASGLLDVETEE